MTRTITRTRQMNLSVMTEPYNTTTMKKQVNKPEVARIKCNVKFLDGNSMTMYSLDSFYSYHYRATVVDESKGFNKLVVQLRQWEDKIEQAVFYLNFNKVPLTSKPDYDYFLGKFIDKELNLRWNFSFTSEGKVDLSKFR